MLRMEREILKTWSNQSRPWREFLRKQPKFDAELFHDTFERCIECIPAAFRTPPLPTGQAFPTFVLSTGCLTR